MAPRMSPRAVVDAVYKRAATGISKVLNQILAGIIGLGEGYRRGPVLEPVLRPLSSFNERTNDEPMSLPPPGMYRPIGDGLPRATVLQSIVLEWLLAKEGWPASSLGKLMYERLMLAAVPGGAGLNGCSSLFARPSTFSQEDVLLKEAAHPMGKSVTESACNRLVSENVYFNRPNPVPGSALPPVRVSAHCRAP